MTYEEAYRQCLTPDDLLQDVEYDIALAMVTNKDRISIIIQAAEKVLSEKFPEFEGSIDT